MTQTTRTSLAVAQDVALDLNVVRAAMARTCGHPITVSDTIQNLIKMWAAQNESVNHPKSDAQNDHQK
jgi:hypothetical protein